jgi:hypothetical protein
MIAWGRTGVPAACFKDDPCGAGQTETRYGSRDKAVFGAQFFDSQTAPTQFGLSSDPIHTLDRFDAGLDAVEHDPPRLQRDAGRQARERGSAQ